MNPERIPNAVSFREPHPGQNLRPPMLRVSLRKLLLSPDDVFLFASRQGHQRPYPIARSPHSIQMLRERLLIFGRTPFIPGSSEKVAIQVLDLNSKQVSTFPGSENLYSPRLSPDGKHLAALSSDNKKLLIFDFRIQKWTDWVSEPRVITLPTWSRDGRYVYYASPSKTPEYRRVKVGQTRSELIIDLKDLRVANWIGLTPDGAALFVRDVSVNEIYSLEVELP